MHICYRCVDPQDKAFAQGLALVLISLLAFIPGPIMFGTIIGKLTFKLIYSNFLHYIRFLVEYVMSTSDTLQVDAV